MLHVRIKPSDLAIVQKAAELAGESVSEMVRSILVTASRRRLARLGIDANEVKRKARELREYGGTGQGAECRASSAHAVHGAAGAAPKPARAANDPQGQGDEHADG